MNTFPKPKKKELREIVRSDWDLWRLVMSGKFSFDTVFHSMTPLQIAMANTALDLLQEAEEKAVKKAQKKK